MADEGKSDSGMSIKYKLLAHDAVEIFLDFAPERARQVADKIHQFFQPILEEWEVIENKGG